MARVLEHCAMGSSAHFWTEEGSFRLFTRWFVFFWGTAAPLIVYNRLYIYVQAVKVTWPSAREKDTVAPKYSWCRTTVCVSGQYMVHTKCGRFVRFCATAAPLIVYNRLYIYMQAVKVT